jgi:aminoglycoside phosphotransferase (APT) family kinase protein
LNEAIVATERDAQTLEYGAAIVLEPLSQFFDEAGLGAGQLQVTELGDGHSNLTYLVRCGGLRFVLRRPPRGPLSVSTNDVLRESRILEALAETAIPVPKVCARCESPAVIGAPFFVMSFVEGAQVHDGIPVGLDGSEVPWLILDATVSSLAELHAVDLEATGLNAFSRSSGYLERQLRRFQSLLDENATRPLPDLMRVGERLAASVPASRESSMVHGDYRVGNLLFASDRSVAAILDWEMATVGDPLADLGYCTAMWAEPDDPPNPMRELSRVTTRSGFPGRDSVARRYEEITGRAMGALPWYEALAFWKTAILLEGSYRRFKQGASQDAFFAAMHQGVPALARMAGERVAAFE